MFTIQDFELGIDCIQLLGDLSFGELSFQSQGNDTLVSLTTSGEALVLVLDTSVSQLTSDEFACFASSIPSPTPNPTPTPTPTPTPNLTPTPTPENQAPIAVADAIAVAEGGTVSMLSNGATSLIASDSDPDGDAVTLATMPVIAPNHGIITLNGNGSFSYVNDDSENFTDSFTCQISDPDGLTSTAVVDITITPVNEMPTLDLDLDDSSGATGNDFATTFVEGGAVAIADPADLVISDDNPKLASVTVTLTNFLDTGEEALFFSTVGTNILGTYNGGTGILTFTGSDTVANYQTVLRTVTYGNTSANPDGTTRQIEIVVNDGALESAIATSTITMDTINDAPAIAGTLNTTVDEGGTVTITTTELNKDDPDDSGEGLTYTIFSGPTNGRIELSSAPGMAIASFTQADLEANSVQYVHNGSETTADSFSFNPCGWRRKWCVCGAGNLCLCHYSRQ